MLPFPPPSGFTCQQSFQPHARVQPTGGVGADRGEYGLSDGCMQNKLDKHGNMANSLREHPIGRAKSDSLPRAYN
jgi:hypothetical protein